MAHSQTNNVLVYVRMYAVTERGVVGRQVDFGSSDCKVTTAQSGHCPGDSEGAGLSRSEMSSAWQRRHRHTVNSQVRSCQSMQSIQYNR